MDDVGEDLMEDVFFKCKIDEIVSGGVTVCPTVVQTCICIHHRHTAIRRN